MEKIYHGNIQTTMDYMEHLRQEAKKRMKGD
jgi:hypothetical protein